MEHKQGPSQDHQDGPDDRPSPSSVGGGKGGAPNAGTPQGSLKREGKHPLEWMIFGFVVLTFLATATAAWYTRKQWTTAEDAERRSLRPYVGLASFGSIHINDQGGAFIIWAIWENFGATPTVNAVMTTHNAIIADGPVCPDFGQFIKRPVAGLISPHQQIDSHPYFVSDADEIAAERRQKFIYLWGQVEYNDPFQGTPRHITRICRLLLNVAPLAGNRFIARGASCDPEGDCADEQCYSPLVHNPR